MKKSIYVFSFASILIMTSCGGAKPETETTETATTDSTSAEETAPEPEPVLEFTVENLLKDLSTADPKEKYDGKWITLEGEVYSVSDKASYNDSATISFDFVVDKNLYNSAKVTPNTAKDAYLYDFGCSTYLSPTYVANNKDIKIKPGDKIKLKGRFENHFSSGPQFDKAIVLEHTPK